MTVSAPPEDPPTEDVQEEEESASDASDESRTSGEPPKKRRRILRWLAIFAALLVLITGAVAGAAYYLARRTVSNIPKVDVDLSAPVRGDPENFLVIGSDTREEVDDDFGGRSVGGRRSDTIMVLQINPRIDKGIVLSIPRDTRVEIPGHGYDKINAAYAIGGPQLAVDTVTKFTGLKIHHYVEINFEGFQELVDAVGGVDICVDAPIRDKMSGLDLKEEGCHHLTGEYALAYVRSRHAEIYEDGRWKDDTAGDFGRIERQQTFIRALMKQAVSVNAVTRWREYAAAVEKGVKIDNGVNVNQFLELYSKFGEMTPDKVEMLSVPGDSEMIGGVSYVIAKQPEANNLFHSLGGEIEGMPGSSPLPTSVQQIQVKVLNGTSESGLAQQWADKLKAQGFVILGTGSAKGVSKTQIQYRRGEEEKAKTVQQALGGIGVLIESSRGSTETAIVIILGKDAREAMADSSGSQGASSAAASSTGSAQR